MADNQDQIEFSDSSIQRLKLWLNFWKHLIVGGAVALAIVVAPAYINSQIQNRELRVKEKEQDIKLAIAKDKSDAEIRAKIGDQERLYVNSYIQRGTDLNTENRYRFTRYFSVLTKDPDYKAGWTKLFEDASDERDAKKEELRQAELNAKGKTGEELNAANAEIESLKEELASKTSTSHTIHHFLIDYQAIDDKAPCADSTTPKISSIFNATIGQNILYTNVSPYGLKDSLSQGASMADIMNSLSTAQADVLGDDEVSGIRLEDLWGEMFAPNPSRRSYVENVQRICVDGEGNIVGDIIVLSNSGEILYKYVDASTKLSDKKFTSELTSR